MHELPLVKSIYQQVMKNAEKNNAKKVTLVVLQIGILRDFIPELVQKYWDYITKDSIASGSEIVIEEVPAFLKCHKCHKVYPINLNEMENNACPMCLCKEASIVTGNELKIRGIEIERNHEQQS